MAYTEREIPKGTALTDLINGLTQKEANANDAAFNANNAAQNAEYRGVWNSTAEYYKNNTVLVDNTLYIALRTNTNAIPAYSNLDWKVAIDATFVINNAETATANSINATANANAVVNKLDQTINIVEQDGISVKLYPIGETDSVSITEGTFVLNGYTIEIATLTYNN